MSVYVVTDSTSCLPPELAAQYGITVLNIHTRGAIPAADEVDEDAESEEPKTDRDSTLEKPDDESATEQSAIGQSAEGETLEAEGLAVEDNDGDASQAAQSSDSASKPGSDRTSDSASDPTSDPTTAGLGPLELTAAYARLLERGGDDGVIAIHLSRELSSTWSSAVQAAAVFHGLVNVIDTRSAGMVLGQAAIAAARCARSGGTLDECAAAAQHVIDGAEVWLYVHRLDALARGGRLSTAQRLLSTALAIKPILHLSEGKIELAAKTRTQSKAMSRLVSLAQQAYRDAATPVDGDAENAGSADGAGNGDGADDAVSVSNGDESDVGGNAGGSSVSIADITRTSDADAPTTQEPESKNPESVTASTGDSHQPGAGDDRPRVFTFGGDHDFWLRRKREEPVPLTDLPAVPMRLDIHQAGCPEVAQELEEKLRSTLPDCVEITMVDLSPALLVHTGPVAVGITLVRD